MLAINNKLGFRTAAVHTTWQLATDRLSALTREKVATGPAD
jgi:hypothetical protein